MKKALITGISGQDGSYLAEFLLSKGYEVFGIVRRNQLEDPERDLWRLTDSIKDIHLFPGSIESYAAISQIINECQPDECYHLAASSYVSYSLEDSFSTINANVNGTLNVISAIHQITPQCRFYFAGSSELFGRAEDAPQNEKTPFHPRSIYGITKAAGYYFTENFREDFQMYACNGILFNHESPRRGFEYVTRKITHGAAKIKLGLSKNLKLGNLDATRDWGYAKDYVKAMWMMLQIDEAEDFVIATGEQHSVRDFCEIAFARLDMDYHDYVLSDKVFYRPAENIPLIGNATYAREKLGWAPSLSFKELVELMVDADYELLNKA